MSILDYLPTFGVVEINRSTGLVMGHVLSQFPNGAGLTLNTTAVSGESFLENGRIVGLSNDNTIEDYDSSTHQQPFLVFIEELNTFMSGLKYYAEPVVDSVVYPRAIGLYAGDTFTTNNFSGTYSSQAFAKVSSGAITLQDVYDADTIFKVEASTLPTGGEALRFTFLGTPKDYTVYDMTYELDGGTNAAGNPDTFVEGALPFTLLDATKEGYDFGGWFEEVGLSTEIAIISTAADETVYADFTVPTEYDITYNLDGSTNAAGNPATYNIEDTTITLADPTDGTGTFQEWNTQADGLGDTVTEIPLGSTGDVELYAIWE